ncbi:hypothetical protein ABW21_db0208640 [Orbilia brochopaga]|nr:hypothetical protein ABW21_db0208640 [Drechslerella brochopaga]
MSEHLYNGKAGSLGLSEPGVNLCTSASRLGCSSLKHNTVLPPELLQHIFSFVSPLIYNKEIKDEKPFSDADRFKDLVLSCRMVCKTWKDIIDNAPALQPYRYQVGITPEARSQIAKHPAKYTLDVSDLLKRPVETSRDAPSPRIALCVPFIKWLAQGLRRIQRDADVTRSQPNWLLIRDMFDQEGFPPDMYITYPPVVHAHIAVDHDYEPAVNAWHDKKNMTMPGGTCHEPISTQFENREDMGGRKMMGIWISSDLGITTKDLIDGLYLFLNVIMAPYEDGYDWAKDPRTIGEVDLGVFTPFPDIDLIDEDEPIGKVSSQR